jgi:4-hydroxy-tetrahydrodipicolinate reductase
MAPDRYRVVQWATGNIGVRALREVIQHPGLELVGVVVYDPEKSGADAGTLCGLDPVGITATTDGASIVALDADCVLYMARALDLDDILPLLESGTNIVTTRGELFAGGQRLDEADRQRVLDACTTGQSSVFATGSSPGFITDALPMALLSCQRDVTSIQIDEYANLSRRDSAHLLFELMGFGRTPETYNPERASRLLGEFAPALGILAEAAGRPVDEWVAQGEVAVARRNTTLSAGELEAGTVAAQRNHIIGRSEGRDFVRFTASWYCTDEVEPAWDLGPTGWRVQVHGDAPFDLAMPFPVAIEDFASTMPAYTAIRPVNAIPYVCAAPPGILAAEDLPPIVPAGPRGRRPARSRSA